MKLRPCNISFPIKVLVCLQIVGSVRLWFAGRTEAKYETLGNAPGVANSKKLGDGCYHIFLDVGSNIGMHGRFLFEPMKYPKSRSSVATFAAEFGADRDNRDLCVFAIEPNPRFQSRHSEIEMAYGAMGWRYYPIYAGASDLEGNMTFYHSHMPDDPGKPEVGGSALAAKTLYGDNATSSTVPMIRLASWIESEIEGRKLPTKPFGANATSIGPKVIMKLDIEGSEYVVFPDLLSSGVLCKNIDFLLGEFHGREVPNIWPLDRREENNGLFLEGRHAKEYTKWMLQIVDTTVACKTRYSLQDDESYWSDGVAFPKPEAW